MDRPEEGSLLSLFCALTVPEGMHAVGVERRGLLKAQGQAAGNHLKDLMMSHAAHS